MRTTFIVNADDFGLTSEVNQGILKAHTSGIVTSTSVMSNMPQFELIEEASRNHPDLGIGLHVCLSEGSPVSNPDSVATLVDAYGNFHTRAELFQRLSRYEIDLREVALEVRAQLDALLRLGIQPDHWNSHQYAHLHVRLLKVFKSVLSPSQVLCMRTHERAYVGAGGWLRGRRKLSLYRRAPSRLAKDVYFRFESWRARHQGFRVADGQLTRVPFRSAYGVLTENAASNASAGVYEWICHPSTVRRPEDKEFMDRPGELAMLTQPRLVRDLRESGVRLATFTGALGTGVA